MRRISLVTLAWEQCLSVRVDFEEITRQKINEQRPRNWLAIRWRGKAPQLMCEKNSSA
jgi:hypothetical protein